VGGIQRDFCYCLFRRPIYASKSLLNTAICKQQNVPLLLAEFLNLIGKNGNQGCVEAQKLFVMLNLN